MSNGNTNAAQTSEQAITAEAAADYSRAWERTTKHGTYYVSDLRAAFERVENRDDWKAPIDASVLRENATITAEAICFYHGARATVYHGKSECGYVRITSPGYSA